MREVDTVTNEDIRRALLSVRPDDAARARMLGHIRSSAALERTTVAAGGAAGGGPGGGGGAHGGGGGL